MIMVGHETEAMDLGSISFCGRLEIAEESLIIILCLEDAPPFIPSGSDVVESMGIFDPQRSSHGKVISNLLLIVKSVGLTPTGVA